MRILYWAALSVSISTWPAHAALVLDRGAVGTSFSLDYGGAILGIDNPYLGATGNFIYTGASSDGRTYNFTYALTNDSTIASQIRSFGLDVIGTAVSTATSTGSFATALQNPLSVILGTDLCFAASSLGGCSSGSGGLSAGQRGTGSFALNFASSMASVKLDGFQVNYTGVLGLYGATGTGDLTSVVGQVSAAPDPSTWATMLAGFALIGMTLRRRRTGRRRYPL